MRINDDCCKYWILGWLVLFFGHHIFVTFVAIVCSFTKSCPTLCNPMNCSTPDFPVLHHLLEFAQTHIYWVGDATTSANYYKDLGPVTRHTQFKGKINRYISKLLLLFYFFTYAYLRGRKIMPKYIELLIFFFFGQIWVQLNKVALH